MSSDFVGMTFPMVAEICLIKLHILLIGVEVETNADSSGILFNPSPSIFRFSENSRGIFIAQNPQAVKRSLRPPTHLLFLYTHLACFEIIRVRHIF